MNSAEKGVWFIYDGDCPICDFGAHAFRIKREYGELHLLNARTDSSHPLFQQVNRLGLDLDAGMVIVAGEKFYHGKTALRFMAQYGDDRDWFNRANKKLFRSKTTAMLLYPWMRGFRNVLILIRRKGWIDNLRQSRNSAE